MKQNLGLPVLVEFWVTEIFLCLVVVSFVDDEFGNLAKFSNKGIKMLFDVLFSLLLCS